MAVPELVPAYYHVLNSLLFRLDFLSKNRQVSKAVSTRRKCLAGHKEARLKPICACHKPMQDVQTGLAKKEKKKKEKIFYCKVGSCSLLAYWVEVL